MKSYFPIIDLLRFMAALSVVSFHYFSARLVPSNFVEIYIKHGYMGVQLFFIISGFVIYFSLTRSVREYAWGRILRLYPMFWALCTITYISTLIFDYGGALDFRYYLYNLLIVNTGQTAYMVDGSYWTLTMEIVFYVMIGVYVSLFKLKNVEWFYVSWLVITYAIFSLSLENVLISKLLLVRYSPYFIMGGLAALIYATYRESDILVNARRHLTLGLAALAPFYISTQLTASDSASTNSFGLYGPENIIILLAIYLVVATAILVNERVFSASFIKFCKIAGAITYPLYLLHQKFGSLLINKIGGLGEYGNISATSISVFIFIIVLCYILSKYEERYRKILFKRLIS